MHSGNIHALPRRTKRIPSPICVGELGWSAACSGLGARCIARIAQADACSRKCIPEKASRFREEKMGVIA
jgi:hypothetical protein